MCNAWNHPPGCTCGWGGLGHLGRKEPGSNSQHTSDSECGWVLPITHTYESYVNPNAHCPICGAFVFFYQSPNGGRVFFDELGPPWPKHPCTDNSSIPNNIGYNSLSSVQKPSKKYGWEMNGWTPFFIKSVSRIDKIFQKIKGVLGEEEITLYTKSILKHHRQVNIVSAECISHARKAGGNKYKISLVTTSGDTTEITAFKLLSEARKGIDVNKALRQSKPKPKRKKFRTNPKKKAQNKRPSRKINGPGNNAMALAFAAARNKNDDNT